MPKRYPEHFFFTTPGSGYAKNPPGQLDVSRLVRNLPPWQRTDSSSSIKPKTLIVNDWTATFWLPSKLDKFIRVFRQLIADGFSVYLWQGKSNPIQQLTLDSLSLTTECRDRMELIEPVAISHSATLQFGLATDQIQVLDDHQIECLLEGLSADTQPRVVKESNLPKTDWNLEKALVFLCDASPPLTHVVMDTFYFKIDYPNIRHMIADIVKKKLDASIVRNFFIEDALKLEVFKGYLDTDSPSLQDKTQIKTAEIKLRVESHLSSFNRLTGFSSLEVLKLSKKITSDTLMSVLPFLPKLRTFSGLYCSEGKKPLALPKASLPSVESFETMGSLSADSLTNLFAAMPRLKNFALTNGENHHDIQLEAKSLMYLEDVNFTNSKISAGFFQSLVAAAPNLCSIDITANENCFRGLALAPNSLSKLINISVSCTEIDSAILQQLLAAAPNLQELDINDCYNIDETLKLPSKSLTYLKSITLSDHSIINLPQFFAAAPKLKSISLWLSVDEPTEWNLGLESNDLPHLETLIVNQGNIHATTLKQFLAAAVNLKKLDIIGIERENLLVLKPGSLSHLETINATEINTSVFQQFLKAAPQVQDQLKAIFMPSQAPAVTNEEGSNQDIEDAPISIDRSFNLNEHLTHQPSPPDFKFHYQKEDNLNLDLSQTMIIRQLSQYLTLFQTQLELIPKIQGGICKPLSEYFISYMQVGTNEFWRELLAMVQAWDGQLASLSTIQKLFFTSLLEFYPHNNAPQYYLGDNFAEILTKNPQPFCVGNIWHAIGLIPDKDSKDHWWVYDPNFVEGPKQVKTKHLKEVLTKILGTQLFAIDPNDKNLLKMITPVINDVQQFVREGGLHTLCFMQHPETIISQLLASKTSYSREDLTGLLLKDTNGRTALNALLEHPLLYQNLESWLWQVITQHADFLLSFEDPPASAFAFSDKLKKIQAEIQHLHSQFKPLPLPAPRRLTEYVDELITDNEQVEKRLLHCHNQTSVETLLFALEDKARKNKRPVFYVHSAEDLICSARWVKRDLKNSLTGTVQAGPGGPLYDFLQKNRHSNPLILINYDHFTPNDIVRFNALLDDKKPNADGTPLPAKTSIIAAMNIQRSGAYQESDFTSRFKVEVCPVVLEDLTGLMPQLGLVAEVKSTIASSDLSIDLYNGNDREMRLLGGWVIKKDRLQFQPGLLKTALSPQHQRLIIKNGPWHDPKFKAFWQRALRLGSIEKDGNLIQLPKHLQLQREEGYPHLQPPQCIPGILAIPDTQILNPSLLEQFFCQYHYDKSSKTLDTSPGLIEEYAKKGQSLAVNLTRSLTLDQWARLLDSCTAHKVQLQVHFPPGVSLPSIFQSTLVRREAKAIPSHSKTQIIESTDVDATLAGLPKDPNKPWQIIDISECSESDLLHRITPIWDQEKGCYQFSKTQQALLNGLEQGEHIVLTGNISNELADALAPLLFKRHLLGNHPGRLLIVSKDCNAFHYLPIKKVKERVMELSYCQQRAIQAQPDQDPYQGMKHLNPSVSEPYDEKCLADSKKISQAFIEQRIKRINQVLQTEPYVFITGVTGIGKSTFVEQEFREWLLRQPSSGKLFQGEEAIESWAKDKTPGRKVLFLDEINIGQRQCSKFEGLFHDPPGILIAGTFHRLTPEHKVIFAGNPVSYGGERQLDPLFERHGNAVLFKPLPAAFLYEKILKPLFANTPLQKQSLQLSQYFLQVYHWVNQRMSTQVLISPRELEMMALLLLSNQQCYGFDKQRALDAAQHYAYEIGLSVLAEKDRESFKQAFAPQKLLLRPADQKSPAPKSSSFLVTPSRHGACHLLEDLLILRRERRLSARTLQAFKLPPRGGIGGLVLEGMPGVGKSNLIETTLENNGYVDSNFFPEDDQCFCVISPSMDMQEKQALLLKAFDRGWIVVMEEINSSPMMEYLLNHLLMGQTPAGVKALTPGFMVLGTQNPITLAGRQATSTALSRRLLTYKLVDYPKEELVSLLCHQGMEIERANYWASTYQQQLSPVPLKNPAAISNARDLLRLAKKTLLAETSLSTQTKKPSKKRPVLVQHPDIQEPGKLPKIQSSLTSSGFFSKHDAATKTRPKKSKRPPPPNAGDIAQQPKYTPQAKL